MRHIRNVRVVDVRRGVASEPRSVLLDGGRIEAVVEPNAAPDEGWDAGGRFLAPGLIDGHVHFFFDCGATPRESFMESGPQARLDLARRNARIALEAGITTMRDCGGPVPLVFELRRELEADPAAGPNLLCCGTPLMRPRGHCHFLGGEVATPDQVRRRIETHLGQGASFVKLMASGGGLTPGTDPSAADLPRELVRAAVETAHASGAHVAAHCHATESIVRCLEEGVDTIEHASFVEPPGRYRFDPEVAARLGAAGIAVAPTVIGALRTARRFRASGALHNPSDAAAVERLEGRLTNTGHFHRLGLRILAGTDCGCTDTPFDSLVDELLAYTSAGLSRAEALRSATSGAAEILGLPETGEIRPGARADLLLVAADPLEGLEVLRRPDMVLRSGRVVHRRPGMEAPAVRG